MSDVKKWLYKNKLFSYFSFQRGEQVTSTCFAFRSIAQSESPASDRRRIRAISRIWKRPTPANRPVRILRLFRRRKSWPSSRWHRRAENKKIWFLHLIVISCLIFNLLVLIFNWNLFRFPGWNSLYLALIKSALKHAQILWIRCSTKRFIRRATNLIVEFLQSSQDLLREDVTIFVKEYEQGLLTLHHLGQQ